MSDKTNEIEGSADAKSKDKKAPIDWWGEIKGLLVLVLAVLAFHTFIAKPFYIPSSSMMNTLLVGDRLIVSKFPYGYSWVSPSFRVLPPMEGRLFGSVPERGDIVILNPPGDRKEDWIKRVIGLPGDILELREGQILINGEPVPQETVAATPLPVDQNNPCTEAEFPGARQPGRNGEILCYVPTVRETLPNGASYEVLDARRQRSDNVAPVLIPEDHVYLMGDNRDNSADSRVSLPEGLNGPVPIENIGGRAEFITFSLDGTENWNPLTWWSSLRDGRSWRTLHPRQTTPATVEGPQG